MLFLYIYIQNVLCSIGFLTTLIGLTFAGSNFRDFPPSAKISTREKFGMMPTAKINTREKNEKKTMIREIFFLTEAMKAGKASLQPLDPFHDIDPVVEFDDQGVDFNLREVCNLNES